MHTAAQRPAHCRKRVAELHCAQTSPSYLWAARLRPDVGAAYSHSRINAPTIRAANPVEYWSCADLHVRVFHESHRDQQEGRPAADTSPLASLWHVLERVDHVSCLEQNDALGRIVGKNALLVASEGDAPTTQTTSSAAAASTRSTDDSIAITRIQQQYAVAEPGNASMLDGLLHQIHTEVLRQAASLAHRVVTAAVQPGVGLTAEQGGLVGVASLDAFGDKVPPRQLNPYSTGAFGWYRREGIAYLSNVAVLPAARRQGVARALVAAAEKMSSEWGCRAIGLHCNPKNKAAMELYKALGYRVTSILEPPWIPYLMGRPPDRCMFMVKRLPAAAGTTITARGRNSARNITPATPAATPSGASTASAGR